MGSTKIVAVMLGLGMLSCGDRSPQEQCEDLVDQICDRASKCIAGAEGTHDECVVQFKRVSGCAQVVTASGGYDACTMRVASQSCGGLFGNSTSTRVTVILPVECMDVVHLMQNVSDTPARSEAYQVLAQPPDRQ